MPKMQTSFNGLVSLLAKNLYTSPDVFIRELIQNAQDGCQRRLALDPEYTARIDISTSTADRTISFADNGVGMDEPDIHEYLSTIGRSGTAAETARLNAAGLAPETIGQFGVGLLSAFVVAERIDVFTRKLGLASGFHWLSHGSDDYEVTPASDAPECGTDITLTLKAEFAHYLREKELIRTVQLFADFLSIPIYVNGNGPVNVRFAPWDAESDVPRDRRDEEYHQFLERRYNDRPLLVIPIHLKEPNARGVLYVTDQPIPGIGASGHVDIYVRRMCIRLNDGELLPEWATFIRGVIDADVQPTASRDNLQRDNAYHVLRRELGAAIIGALLKLQQTDPLQFASLSNWHEAGIKGMALRDDAFFASVIPHLPFATNEGTLSLTDFIARQKPLPSGRKPIFYFSFDGDETQFFQLCSANKLMAINASRLFDEHILRKYASQRGSEVELRKLDHLNSQQIYALVDEETATSFQPVTQALKTALTSTGFPNVEVSVRRYAPESLAAVLIDQPGAEVLDRLKFLLDSPLLGSGIQSLASEVAARVQHKPMDLLLNVSNPLVQSLRQVASFGAAQARDLLLGLFHLAVLNSQRRVKSEHARQIDGYLQSRLGEILKLRQELSSASEQTAAWRKCVEQPTAAANDDWVAVSRNLIGCTPAEFRERVAGATDAGIGELLLGLYRQMKQA